jgi:hypothetical protein
MWVMLRCVHFDWRRVGCMLREGSYKKWEKNKNYSGFEIERNS